MTEYEQAYRDLRATLFALAGQLLATNDQWDRSDAAYHDAGERLRVLLASSVPATASEGATEGCVPCGVCGRDQRAGWCLHPAAGVTSSDRDRGLGVEDGPECETCGRTTCPDAQLPGFSEPRTCEYTPIFEALRDAKDCDYGCARDLTNQDVRLYVVPAVDRIVETRVAQALARCSHPAVPGENTAAPVLTSGDDGEISDAEWARVRREGESDE